MSESTVEESFEMKQLEPLTGTFSFPFFDLDFACGLLLLLFCFVGEVEPNTKGSLRLFVGSSSLVGWF